MVTTRTGARVEVPDGYRIERHESLDLAAPVRVRFDVIDVRDGSRLVAAAKVRRWAGEWRVQRTPTAGVPITADEAEATAYAILQAIEAARRGNDGFAP